MLVVAGLAVGWVSEAVRRAGGHGFLIDMSIALVGSGIVGGIVVGGISTGLGMAFGLGRGVLLPQHPPGAAGRPTSLFEQAQRVGGHETDGWVLYRIGKDEPTR